MSAARATGPALFEPEGDAWRPTAHARGPWDPGALHGGAVAALVVRSLEAEPGAGAGAPPLSRLTLELLRPVPMRPLRLEVRNLRPGRRVQLDRVEVSDGEQLVASALGGRIRADAVEVPAAGPAAIEPGPESSDPPQLGFGDEDAFHSTGVELRFAGRWSPGSDHAVVWVRLLLPVVPGEDPTPFQRVAAAADFGNGVSSPLDHRRTTFINPDLTVVLHRDAEGEWIGMESTTRLGPAGRGLSESLLHDRRGPVGRAVQSLVLARR